MSAQGGMSRCHWSFLLYLPCRRQRNLTDLLPLCAHDLEERGEEVAPIPLATISIAD